MKLLFLLLLPALGWAQAQVKVQAEPDSDGYLYGSYTLSTDGTKHDGFMQLPFPQKLVVRVLKGKNLKYTSADVSRFTLGEKRYFTLTGVKLPGPQTVADLFDDKSGVMQAFVEQVDSGRVVLLSYSFLSNAQYHPEVHYYLLRQAGSPDVVIVPYKDKQFRELLRPYLQARPDLLKYLDEKRLTISTLPDLIHSLNTGVSYLPPERFPRAEE